MSKKKKILTILAVILLPTVVVGGYYGFKFAKKKWDERKAKKLASGSKIDTTGMVDYTIAAPSGNKFFLSGELFDAIKDVGYYYKNTTGMNVNIKLHPKDLPKLKAIIEKLDSSIKVL